MARGPCTFKQQDATRAARAAIAAGLQVQRIEFENGRIIVVIGKPNDEATVELDDKDNPWAKRG